MNFTESSTSAISLPIPQWKSLKDRVELFRYPVGNDPNPDIQISLLITFADVPGVAREPMVSVLNKLAHMVESIIDAAPSGAFL